MIWPFRRKQAQKKPVSRIRMFLVPFVLCALAGFLNLAMPLEDLYQGLRNTVRARPADKSVVLVAIDDATIARLGTSRYSRKYNAQLIDKLTQMGAKRVYFDEALSKAGDPAGDQAFVDALNRHKSKIFLGSFLVQSYDSAKDLTYVPLEQFRNSASLVSLNVVTTPFHLSNELPFAGEALGQNIPSLSASLAGESGNVEDQYRPDWAIQIKDIPVASLIDVLDGKIQPTVFNGKDVIVGVTAQAEPDFIQIIGQGWVPGVYSHLIGAQTLREGNPISVGPFPALVIAALLSIMLLRSKSGRQVGIILIAALLVGVLMPFILDNLLIHAKYIPAYVLFGVIAYRANTQQEISRANLRNATTLLPNLAALREEPAAALCPIIAMRIRNYAAVGASFSDSVESELITEVARRLTLPGQSSSFYQAEDVLYWLAPSLPQQELQGHIAGLSRLMESLFLVRGRKIDVHVAFGVDTDLARPVANRIGRALLAADTAASKHQPYMFNTSDNDEESAWELSLMSELDAAIDNGDIWIAYQPQFELKSDQVIGAEALVRWQHPTRGAISPEAFILQAEEHNRIGRLTFHVLELATQAAKHVVERNPTFRLSVNISATLMELPDLPSQIVTILDKTGFPTSNLTLEVTESAPFAEHAIVAFNLTGIAALGIDLSIDDYGTGNATLEYLRSVPCQEIKIDRKFVTGLVEDNGDMMLVESTIELAHGMGRRVIAEGIEDPETLELLRAIGCDIAQGYYLAKPMRIEALESFVSLSARFRAA